MMAFGQLRCLVDRPRSPLKKLMVLMVAIAAGCGGSSKVASRAHMIGSVVNELGQPITEFSVKIWQTPDFDGTIRKEGLGPGRFEIDGLRIGGRSLLAISSNGYYTIEERDVSPVGSRTVNISVVLPRDRRSEASGAIEGRLTVSKRVGYPSVLAMIPGVNGSWYEQTDIDGNYCFAKLPPQGYLLIAKCEGEVHNTYRFESRRVAVEPGETTRADFELTGVSTIRGKVTFGGLSYCRILVRPFGSTDPVPWSRYWLVEEETIGEAVVWGGENGQPHQTREFRIANLPEGEYRLSATCMYDDMGLARSIPLKEKSAAITLRGGEMAVVDFDLTSD